MNLFIFILNVVPSAPQDIKAIPASNTKVIVSWLPPLNLNGEIVSEFFKFYRILLIRWCLKFQRKGKRKQIDLTLIQFFFIPF